MCREASVDQINRGEQPAQTHDFDDDEFVDEESSEKSSESH